MIRAALLSVLLFAAAACARADEVGDLAARYVAWRGGTAFEHMTTAHQTGTVQTAGLKGTFESWAAADGRSRQDVDLGVVKSRGAFTRDGGWSLNQSGQIETASPREVEDARRAALLNFADVVEGKAGARLSLIGRESRDGATWSVLRVSFGDPDSYDLFIDPATGALDGMRVTTNRRTTFQRLSDWRMVGGVRTAFRQETIGEVRTSDATVLVASTEINTPLDPALFERPAARRAASFTAGKTSTGWLPFDFFGENRIFIPARVNGHEVALLLDSGAESSVLDKTFASQIGVRAEGAVTAMGTGGTDTASLAGGVRIQIGDMTLDNLTVAVLDLSGVAPRLGHALPVVLGKEVLNELIVDIDFAGRRIAFSDPAGFAPPPGAVAVKVTPNGGIRSIDASVEGGAPVPMDFDLGNGSPLILFPAFWQDRHILDGRPSSKSVGGAVGGENEEGVTTIRSLTLAGVTFHDIPAVLTPPAVSAVNNDRTVGNIGLPILSRFRLITDYPHDRIWLVPNPTEAAKPFQKDRSGLVTIRDGQRLRVKLVSPGSPAEAAGWKVGDEIVAINGEPVTDRYPGSATARWRGGAPGTRVVLTMADGSRRTLVLKDYF